MTRKRYRLLRYGHFFRSADTLQEARDIAWSASKETAIKIWDDGSCNDLSKLIETWRPPTGPQESPAATPSVDPD